MSTATKPDATSDDYVRSLTLSLVRSLVKDTAEVPVTLAAGDGYSTIQVRGSEETISVLVGVKGQMARALRTLLAGTSAKLGRRYALDLSPDINL